MKLFLRSPATVISLLATAMFACEPGCATPTNSQPGTKTAADDEWVTLPPETGSNMPRHVRRSELGTAASASKIDALGVQALNNPDRPNSVTSPGSGGK